MVMVRGLALKLFKIEISQTHTQPGFVFLPVVLFPAGNAARV